jgi:hypothetical protein
LEHPLDLVLLASLAHSREFRSLDRREAEGRAQPAELVDARPGLEHRRGGDGRPFRSRSADHRPPAGIAGREHLFRGDPAGVGGRVHFEQRHFPGRDRAEIDEVRPDLLELPPADLVHPFRQRGNIDERPAADLA